MPRVAALLRSSARSSFAVVTPLPDPVPPPELASLPGAGIGADDEPGAPAPDVALGDAAPARPAPPAPDGPPDPVSAPPPEVGLEGEDDKPPVDAAPPPPPELAAPPPEVPPPDPPPLPPPPPD